MQRMLLLVEIHNIPPVKLTIKYISIKKIILMIFFLSNNSKFKIQIFNFFFDDEPHQFFYSGFTIYFYFQHIQFFGIDVIKTLSLLRSCYYYSICGFLHITYMPTRPDTILIISYCKQGYIYRQSLVKTSVLFNPHIIKINRWFLMLFCVNLGLVIPNN